MAFLICFLRFYKFSAIVGQEYFLNPLLVLSNNARISNDPTLDKLLLGWFLKGDVCRTPHRVVVVSFKVVLYVVPDRVILSARLVI